MSHTLYEMLDLGAEDCYYYTLRWPGHLNVAKTMFMMGDKFGISEEEVIKYITEITANTGTDIVLGKAVVEYDSNRGDGTMLRDICSIVYHAEQGFSAMQLATAIPAAAMIDYMLAYDLKGYLTYNDLDYKEIENTVASIRSKIGLMAETGGTIIDAHDKYEEGTDDAV
jgi:saccharopine dehydrogenase-like NADP-dependent oxidoreductase